MNETIEPYDPDKEGGVTAPPTQTTKPVQQGGNGNSEVKPIDGRTSVDFDDENTPDEFPKRPPVPNGSYDVVWDTVKYHYSKAGNLTLDLTFRVVNPAEFENRLIWVSTVPTTDFGKILWKKLRARSITTNAKGEDITLLQKLGKMSIDDMINSGVAINARTHLTVKQVTKVFEGESRINLNVTAIDLPTTNKFM